MPACLGLHTSLRKVSLILSMLSAHLTLASGGTSVGAHSLSVSAAVCCTATECLSAPTYNACLASPVGHAEPVGGRFDMYVFVHIFFLAQDTW